MYKSTIILILASLYISSAITFNGIGVCVGANCTTQYSTCLNDTLCSNSLECFSNCQLNDTVCQTPCSQMVQTSLIYWEFQLCALACMEILEYEENAVELPTCVNTNCGSNIIDCQNDASCTSSLNCFEACDQPVPSIADIDYSCPAECLIDAASMNKNSSNVTLLAGIVQCEISCIVSFVTD